MSSASPGPSAELPPPAGFTLPATVEEPLRVLLVEDSNADADLIVGMLEDEIPNVVVTVTATMAGALPLLAGSVDIAITDLSLPDADGLQALTAILAARPDLAVVVMTGRRDRELALQALAAGAEDYLVKGSQDARAVATAVLYASQRRSAENEAHRYERLALSLLNAMEASTCAVDAAGQIIAVNQAWRDFARDNGGDPGRTGIGANYFEICDHARGADQAIAAEVSAGLRQVLRGDVTRFERHYPCDAPDEERWMSLRINALPESGAVLSHVDVSGATRAELAVAHLTLHDVLTNLPNRSLLVDRLSQALAWARREDTSVAVAFLDVDLFKRINDGLGHAAGDELLRALAGRLTRCIREGDTLARLAADEFVVVWPDVSDPREAARLAERLTDAVSQPFVLRAGSVTVTISVGVVVGRPPQDADELLLAADAAMYDAKTHGQGQTRLYTTEMRGGAESRLRTETDLRAALERGEFVLSYQPVVDLRRNDVVGVEALVRWQHPDGLRMPDTFIPVAEATGLIVPLGTWVLQTACRQGAAWAAAGLQLAMAVNFSTRQISHPDLVAGIEDALGSSGLRPDLLLVEVTESTVMAEAEQAQISLAKIAKLGASIAIDDFGTGYSSLLYLKRYPIQALKIDRSFVSGMGQNADDDAIVASVISLAHAVGAVCIGEGVETPEQQDALRALGCDLAQGYLFGRPVPAEQLPDLVRSCRALLATTVPAAGG